MGSFTGDVPLLLDDSLDDARSVDDDSRAERDDALVSRCVTMRLSIAAMKANPFSFSIAFFTFYCQQLAADLPPFNAFRVPDNSVFAATAAPVRPGLCFRG